MPSGSGISMLMGLAAPAAQQAEANAAGDDAPHQGQQFAQFLSGFGMGTEGQGAQQFTRGGLLPGAATLLTAQELDHGGEPVQVDLPNLADMVITPEFAGEMGGNVEAMIRITQDPQQLKALTELKDQLKAIEQAGQPKTLATLMQSMPSPQHAKLAMQALRQFFTPEKMDGIRTSRTNGEPPVQPDATVIGLSAAIFRPADGEDTSATAGEDFAQAETGEALGSFEMVTVVQPLAATTTVSVAAPVEAVMDAPVDAVRDLDAAIPSLELDKSSAELPELTLPKIGAQQQQQSATQSQTTSQQTQAFSNYLAQGIDKSGDKPAVADSAAFSGVDTIQPLHVGSHGAVTHAARTAQPTTIDLMPTPGFYNRAPVSEQVHVAIHQATKDGLDRITIQLDPIDLGRVEINMQRSQDGHTQISFMIDKPDTFDNLSRDARMLERTLQEAGIKADTGSMQFNLRQQPQPQMHSDLNGQQQPQQPFEEDEESQHASTAPISVMAALTRNYTVNIREGVDISA